MFTKFTNYDEKGSKSYVDEEILDYLHNEGNYYILENGVPLFVTIGIYVRYDIYIGNRWHLKVCQINDRWKTKKRLLPTTEYLNRKKSNKNVAINGISTKYVKLCLAKQTFWFIHTPASKVIKPLHYKVKKQM